MIYLYFCANNKASIEFSHDIWDLGFSDFPIGLEYSMLLESRHTND